MLVGVLVASSPLSAAERQEEGGAAGDSMARSCVEQLQQGYEALEMGDAERALSHYRAALDAATADPLQLQALFGLGSSYAALGNYGAAISALEHATGLAPQDSGVWYTLGSV